MPPVTRGQRLSYGFGAVANGVKNAAFSTYLLATIVLEFGSSEDTPMRLAFVTTVESAIAATGPILAGLLVATRGFVPLFVIVLAALVTALAILVLKVREPRNLSAA